MSVDLIATVALLVCGATIRNWRNFFLGGRSGILMACGSGFTLVWGAQLFFCNGLRLTSPAVTAPWMLLTPSLVGMFGMILKYESRKKLKILGVCVSLTGVAGIILYANYTHATHTGGLISLMAHSFGLALGLVIWRNVLKVSKQSPLIVATWAVGTGTICMMITYTQQEYFWARPIDMQKDIEGFKNIIGAATVISMAYTCNYVILAWAARKSSISILALYASVRPIFTELASFIVTGQYTAIEVVISCILLVTVLIGLLITTYSKKKEKKSILRRQDERIEGRLQSNFENLAPEYQPSAESPPVYKKLVNN